jgi:nucleotide-binding universal stress UspA family protein
MIISRILVPTDFSADADAALQYAIELGKPFGARIRLLHVVEDLMAAGMWSNECYTIDVTGLQINLVKDAEERLSMTRIAAEAASDIATDVRTGPAATTIVDAARECQADLIVMGTKGRTGVAHLLMGSVAERVVRLAPCPVLTVRSRTEALATRPMRRTA